MLAVLLAAFLIDYTFIRPIEATISVFSSLNPNISGVYVRGVTSGHDHAYAQGGSEESRIWLFHRKLSDSSNANGRMLRWYLGEDITSYDALAFVDIVSDSDVLPCRCPDDNEESVWMVTVKGEWKPDKDFKVTCHGLDPGGIHACDATNKANAVPCVPLVNGVSLPVVMLGTAYISESHGAGRDNPEVVEPAPATELAMDAGYQGLDLGSQVHPAYANEKQVGDLLAARPGRRQSLFLTTKLSPSDHGYQSTLRGAQRSLKLLQTDTIDLFLIHHPRCLMVEKCEGDWVESWKAMERLYELGAVRAIGVSNFDHHLLNHLLGIATVPIALVQNRADPLAPEQHEVLELCREHGIQYQAFSVLGRQWVVGPWSAYWRGTHTKHPILDHPEVVAIADRLTSSHANNVTIDPAQIILRWAIQKGWTVVPKTATPARLNSNRQLFHFYLTEHDMAILDQLHLPPHERGEL